MAFREQQGAAPAAVPAQSIAPRAGGFFRPEDIAADRWVHLAALVLCTAGIPVLLDLAGRSPNRAVLFACSVYAITMVVMFACSTAFYHIPLPIERRRLRQFDHAAIFLAIAGSCTAFTATLLPGISAAAVTALIWLGAVGGATYKLTRPLPFPGFSTASYLLISGIIVVSFVPVSRVIDLISLILLVAGLGIYGTGAVIRVRRSVRYRNTIWHMMVISGAACHYAAIVHGVVLASAVFS